MRSTLVLGALGLGPACGQFRGLEGNLPPCADYEVVLQPLFDARCVDCHQADRAGGGYVLTSRLAALARRPDGSTRVSGPGPMVVAAARGELGLHTALPPDEQETVRAWALDCQAGGRRLLYHPRGWSTPGAEAFHGAALRRVGYRLDAGAPGCTQCHGEDLSGGPAQVACSECHQAGVSACTTCHGSTANAAPPSDLNGSTLTTSPGVGAHQTHLRDGPLHLAYGCTACHLAVVDVWQAGHFQVDGGPEDGRAEVVFAFAFDGGRGEYASSEASCSNTSCHAPSVDRAATQQRPTWTKVGQGEAACGTCHGVPPASHAAEADCSLCHQAAFADGAVVVALHANGRVELGRAGEVAVTCTACHGDGAAFRDLRGRSEPAVVTVGAPDFVWRRPTNFAPTRACSCGSQITSGDPLAGVLRRPVIRRAADRHPPPLSPRNRLDLRSLATQRSGAADSRGRTNSGAHQAHLDGRRGLSSPIGCEACHQVPTELRSPGHLDSPWPAVVFPAQSDAGSGAGQLARSDGASPSWDRTAQSCGGVYCHGGGARGAGPETPPGASW